MRDQKSNMRVGAADYVLPSLDLHLYVTMQYVWTATCKVLKIVESRARFAFVLLKWTWRMGDYVGGCFRCICALLRTRNVVVSFFLGNGPPDGVHRFQMIPNVVPLAYVGATALETNQPASKTW